jgi:hypothetical protein
VRLTFGWRRRTVTLTVPELAAYCRLQPVGGFRRALRELVAEGVVLQLEHDKGRSATTYAIQKDFAAWGRYSIAEARLSAIWSTRPQSDDALLHEIAGTTPQGQTPAGDIPTGSDGTTPQGQTGEPHRVTPTGAKSFDGETVAPSKDSETQGQTEETTTQHGTDAVRDAEVAFRAAMGDQIGPVDRFLETRPARSRANWYPELLRLIGPAMKAIPADLAAACTDALIVDPPVTAPHALRAFVQKQTDTRLARAAPPRPLAMRGGPRAGGVSARDQANVEAGNRVAQIRELIADQPIPGQGSRRILRNADVERLGDDVCKAYRTVGGAARFLAIDAKPDDLPFLINAFAAALHDARHPQEARSA